MGDRRTFLSAGAHGGALVLAWPALAAGQGANGERHVSAVEDLCREHGILRRALLVYEAAAERLDSGADEVPAPALARTARLFRQFGEDYHERKLEEHMIFPMVRKLKGPVSRYPDILEKQHDRGRELTGYVLEVARGPRIGSANRQPLSRALRQFVIMYAHHAAREDTVVFPAWEGSMSRPAYANMSQAFEDVEKQFFGHDGFDDGLKQIMAIERDFGLEDLAALTMPRPPRPRA